MTRSTAVFLLASTGMLGAPAVAETQPYIRIHDDVTAPAGQARTDILRVGARGEDPCCDVPIAFDLEALAYHGQPVPSGGTLSPIAFANPTTMNAHGAIAFFANVDSSLRTNGVFVADENGLHEIALGCGSGGGGGGGCTDGDPSPIGGTYSGFFGGSNFCPAINDAGDVLFLADVTGGSSSRGLFLYRGASDDIIKIAAVGDASPTGGTFVEVGPGSMNNQQAIVFIARRSGHANASFYKWDSGAVSKVAELGDAAPDGGTFLFLNRESFGFADGTSIPAGPIPDINDAGQIAFPAIVTGGPVERGLILQTGASRQWIVRNTDTPPIGGSYLDFWGVSINNGGEAAFFADIRLGPEEFTSGWFAGTSGDIRKVVTFFDEIVDGLCFGLAVSRNPMQPIDDCGNVAIWTDIQLPDETMRETMLVFPPDGEPTVVARRLDPTPLGGFISSFQAWPTMNNQADVQVGCGTPGAGGGSIFNAQFIAHGIQAGDTNNDGVVSLEDLATLLSHFGQLTGATPADGDTDNDGDVDLEDLAVLLNRYGADCN